MKKIAGALLGILIMVVFASSANAAWTYEQTFNTLNNGDLNGQDSWSGASEYDVQSSIAHEGTKAVKVNAVTTSKLIERTVPSFTSGQVYFSVRRDTNSVGYFGVYLRNSTAGHVAFIYFTPAGNISLYEGVAQTERILGTYVPNTWYRIGIDYSAATDQYRANINNGAWSAWYQAVAVTSEINQIKLYADGNANSYFDFVSPNYGASAPTISSVSSSNIAQTTATITWTTDVQTTSQVEYGTTTSYGTSTTLDMNLVTSHTVNLTNLITGTTYHYRVRSKDASNNEAISGDYAFHTQLSLRLPFRDGEEWGISCGYSCGDHINADAYALDFNLSGNTDQGKPVLAVASGKVEIQSYSSGGYGNNILINHGNGYKSRYAHLNSIDVKDGQYVFQGEQIGTVGETGQATGPHLHFAMYKDGAAYKPEPMSVYTGFQSCTVSSPPSGSCYTSTNTIPVAIYHLDRYFVTDSSDKNNNGYLQSGPIIKSGTDCIIGNCLNFNGTSNYLEAPDSPSLSITGVNISIAGWLKTSSSSTQWIVSKYNNGASDASYGLYLSNGYVKFTVSPNGSTGGEVQSTVGVNDGNKRYVVVTYNGTDLTIYIDGAVNTWQSYFITNLFDSASPLRIGAKNSQTAIEFFSEMLDELVIYDRTLTADEANNMYYSSKP